MGATIRASTALDAGSSASFLALARAHWKADLSVGLTVAIMGIPQALAYALVAGVPPMYGLYASIVPCLVSAVLGSSNHLVSGPTNTVAMVTLSLILPLSEKYGVQPAAIAVLLSLVVGLIQLGFGLFRLGGVIRYVSNSVIVGFLAGAGVLIAFNQIGEALGYSLTRKGGHFFGTLGDAVTHLNQTSPYAVFLSALTIALVVLLPRIHKRLPASLIAIVVATALNWAWGWSDASKMGDRRVAVISDTGAIQSDLLAMFRVPDLVRKPDLELTRDVFTGALAVALLGLVEAASISRAIASRTGQRLDFNREFAAQGVGKIAGAFATCMPASGSIMRSALCYSSGGKTRAAAAWSAVWTAAVVVLFAPLANLIPKPVLAGLILVVAFSMIDRKRLGMTWRSGQNPRIVVMGTLVATLVLPMETAIFVGTFLSLGITLRVTGRTDLTQLVPRAEGGFEEVPFEKAPPSQVVTVNMEGDLFSAAVEDLDYELLRALTPSTRVVVLRMKRLRAVGSSAMGILEHFHTILRERDVHLVLCGIEEELKQVMTGSGLRMTIGEVNIFYADNRIFQSTELALARAWSIVEMERKRAQGTAKEVPAGDAKLRSVGAIMARRVIRFGYEHQVREAVWLLSEMLKRRRADAPRMLFLQDREGRMAGALSLQSLLGTLVEGLSAEELRTLGQADLAAKMRRAFTTPIGTTSAMDYPRLHPGADVEDAGRIVLEKGVSVLPVCDEEGRIQGLVEPESLLRALAGDRVPTIRTEVPSE